ncbi:PepSY-associated TM helix domain-containing protein [Sphingobacterium psychroaquaticum]|uniref:Uncharacterized iron-regulated membrane protein n=1 Tax=Sphingobacterium psychroaquaticum TaxID=561061 RepID=A0A1X7HV54_9SPHI|nr:PepSY-associated TM helix domain-containing protein [Sphingobacterium psychroaquaticum]SMG05876.1 Uncharacterized iron-regulated membrane protein [Sphingobacterium psychroaquaticum]
MTKSKKSLFRKISNWLHLWLGLLSGIVVFVVCFTAAIWVFRDEVELFFTPGQSVKVEQGEVLKPSELLVQVKSTLQDIPAVTDGGFYSIAYRGPEKSSVISYMTPQDENYHELFVNPYTGAILYHRVNEDTVTIFHDFLRAGHRFFWFPRPFGSYFVGASCIIFLITLITGLIWWYPSKWNKSTRNKSFKIKWNANWKRINIDLHNVLGFYTLIFTVILTVTGVVFTFSWFDSGYHWLVTGGKPRMEHPTKGSSDTTITTSVYKHADDEIWARYKQHLKMRITYPQNKEDVYAIYIDPTSGHNDITTWFSFDQKTLKQVGGMANLDHYSFGQKVYKANFDIHVGTIGGLTTKIIASIASLVGASLPVTGFIIWYNRKWGKKGKKKQK